MKQLWIIFTILYIFCDIVFLMMELQCKSFMQVVFVTMCLGLCFLEVKAKHFKQFSDEEKLLNHLFKDYNPSARPVLNSSNTVTVDIHFSLLQIQELNVRSQVFATTGLLILDWKDERLVWDRETENPLDQVVIHANHIWKPEFATINGAESIYQDYDEFQAVIYPDGTVRWEPGGVFKTMCTIDITYYPFDEQKCDLTFGAWSYYTSKMNLTTSSVKINLDTYDTNGEWDILDTHVERGEFAFECCPDQRFSNVRFSVFLRRRHTFYIMNVILPGILTSTVLLSIFFCTPQQKVHIGVASLLSFRLFALNVADTIPRTSDHVPLLGVYLTCTMAITTLAMVATVFVLNLYGMKEKPVPPWAKTLFTHYLARFLCMCNCQTPLERRRNNDLEMNRRPKAVNPLQHYKPRSDKVRSESHNDDLSSPWRTRTPENDALLRGNSDHHNALHRRPSANNTPLSLTFRPPGHHERKPPNAEGKPDYSKDWVHVAAVFDRLFFWLCLIFIVVTTLLLFHPLTTSRYFQIPGIKEKDKAQR